MALWQLVGGLLTVGIAVAGISVWRIVFAAVSEEVVAKYEDL